MRSHCSLLSFPLERSDCIAQKSFRSLLDSNDRVDCHDRLSTANEIQFTLHVLWPRSRFVLLARHFCCFCSFLCLAFSVIKSEQKLHTERERRRQPENKSESTLDIPACTCERRIKMTPLFMEYISDCWQSACSYSFRYLFSELKLKSSRASHHYRIALRRPAFHSEIGYKFSD